MENLNVKVDATNGALTVLQGDYKHPFDPNKIVLAGDIKTVASFLKARKGVDAALLQNVSKDKAVIIVDKKALTIFLDVDPQDNFGVKVTGKLEESEELKPWGINKTQFFSKEQLVKLIKFSKIDFDSPEKHFEMLNAFQKLSSTVNISANDSSDERGNKARDFIKTVTTNAPTEFVLSMPIFKGFPATTFKVEVCLDVKEGVAQFWFESVQLHEIQTTEVDIIFNEELKEAKGFVIINK